MEGFRKVPKIPTLQILDPLKVFLEFDTTYGIYVAQCLQTGHLVTADDPEAAKEMIVELLEHEVSLAISANDLSTLVATPAPLIVRVKWQLAAQTQKLEEHVIKVHGEVPRELRMMIGQAEVETEVRIATGRTAAA